MPIISTYINTTYYRYIMRKNNCYILQVFLLFFSYFINHYKYIAANLKLWHYLRFDKHCNFLQYYQLFILFFYKIFSPPQNKRKTQKPERANSGFCYLEVFMYSARAKQKHIIKLLDILFLLLIKAYLEATTNLAP